MILKLTDKSFVMRKIIFSLLFLFIIINVSAQNAGFFGSPLSSVIYNDGNSNDQEANVFDGTNLGLITSLELNGARIRTFKNSGGNVTGAFINYRIYETGSTPPSFTEQSINFSSDDGGGDQTWETSNLSIDLFSGLTPGNYKFEVFFKISTNTGDIFQSDNGNNYTADFSVPYRTDQVGSWNSGTTWVGGVVPPSGSNVSIEHNVNLDISTSVSSVQVSSGTTFTIDAGNTLTSNGGGISGAGSYTVNGIWRIEAGGFTNIAPTYGSSSTLIYADGATYGRGTEWNATTGAGYPNNVTISNSTTLELGANSGTATAKQIAGSLTVDSGSTLTLASPVMTAALTVLGDFVNNGTVSLSTAIGGDLVLEGDFDDSGTFNANGRAVFFQGNVDQNITSSTDPLEIDVMRINKTNGDVIMNQNLVVDETADPLQINSSVATYLNLNGNNLTLGKAGVASSITLANGSGFSSSNSDSVLTILGNGDFGTISFADNTTLNELIIDRQSTGIVTSDSELFVNNIVLTNGTLIFSGGLSDSVYIRGDVRPNNGAGTIDASNAVIHFTSSTTAQTIEAGDFTGTINALVFIANPFGVTVNTDLSVGGLVAQFDSKNNTISAGSVITIEDGSEGTGIQIDTTSELTFESDASGSAQLIDASSSGWIQNQGITVERYIPATDRAFRFVASPVTSSEFIFENWQENGSTPATPDGLGTHITGPNPSASNGLDDSPNDNPSMFTFDNTFTGTQGGATNSAWNAVTDTKGTKLEAGTPYLLFVRGDRSIDLTATTTPPANETTLRATGTVVIGSNTQTLSSVSEYFSLVANPYQAIVDFNALNFTGIANANFMYIYDPATKDYVQLNSAVPADVPNMFIKPGQSFFVVNQNLANAATTVQFDQADINTSGAPTTTVFSDSPLTLLKLELFDDSNISRENLRISFIDNAQNGIDSFDGPKLAGGTEIMATINSGKLYSFERRNLVQSTDIVPLHLSNYQGDNYEFKLNLENWDPNIEIFVQDNYLNTTTQIDPNQPYAFSVDQNIPESIAEDRFSLVFDNTTLGVEENSFGENFSLYPNPTDGQFSIKTPNLTGDVQVEINNLLGQQVYAQKLSITAQEVLVNTEDLASGIYVVKLTQNGQSFSAKLMVE